MSESPPGYTLLSNEAPETGYSAAPVPYTVAVLTFYKAKITHGRDTERMLPYH